MWYILGNIKAKKFHTSVGIILLLITDTAEIVKKQINQTKKRKKIFCLQLLHID